jgi:hypothetical protein
LRREVQKLKAERDISKKPRPAGGGIEMKFSVVERVSLVSLTRDGANAGAMEETLAQIRYAIAPGAHLI